MIRPKLYAWGVFCIWKDVYKRQALLIAIAVVLGFFSVQLTENLKIGFSFIANELTAMLFGPVVGGIMGGVADIIKYLLKPTGPFFFGFTFNAILGAVIYGAVSYTHLDVYKRQDRVCKEPAGK